MFLDHDQIILSERDFERLSCLQNLHLEARLQEENSSLAERLESARVLPDRRLPRWVVTMNSTIVLQDLETDEQEVVTLVYPFSAKPKEGRISIESPLGMALLGARQGETFVVVMEDGSPRGFSVAAIPYQPEAAGIME